MFSGAPIVNCTDIPITDNNMRISADTDTDTDLARSRLSTSDSWLCTSFPLSTAELVFYASLYCLNSSTCLFRRCSSRFVVLYVLAIFPPREIACPQVLQAAKLVSSCTVKKIPDRGTLLSLMIAQSHIHFLLNQKHVTSTAHAQLSVSAARQNSRCR